MVFAKVRGRFGKFSGTIDSDTNRVDVAIETASIDTGVVDRDNHLRSADFFDAQRFPVIRFSGKRLEKTAGGLRLIGDLTIRDVTKEVTLETEDNGKGIDPWGNERVGYSAKTSIDRREFGLKWNQALEAGGVLVGEKVEIELEVQAVRAAAAATRSEARA